MNKPASTWRKICSFIIVQGGFVILWFGFICYAFTTFASIGAGEKNAMGSLFAAPTTLNIVLFASQMENEHTGFSNTEQTVDIPVYVKNFYSINTDEGAAIGSLSIPNKTEAIVNSKFGNIDLFNIIFASTTELSSTK